jgi:hypothetical protein
VTPTPEAPLTGKEADVMLACYQAADLAVATIAPGVTNAKVSFFFFFFLPMPQRQLAFVIPDVSVRAGHVSHS